MNTYYDILDVSVTATNEEIKKAYLKKIKEYHPDIYEGDKDFAVQKTAELNEAYNVLKDENSRKEYDIKHNINQKTTEVENEENLEENENNIFKEIGENFKGFFSGLKSDLTNFGKSIKNHKKSNKNNEENYSSEYLKEKKDITKRRIIIWLLIIVVIILIFLVINIF